jgi:hypothetical protein
MVAEAQARRYGTNRSLVRTFINWQRQGLLGNAVTKTSRRGGEGLWQDRQIWIWLSLLHLREQGAHLRVLANVPVGCWMLGMDGVELDQIQRAFRTFWANPRPLPSLERSPGRRRQVDAAVEYMAVPGATVGARRRLRRILVLMSEHLPELGVSGTQFQQAAQPVLVPVGHPTEKQRQALEDAYGVMSIRALALSHLVSLARHTEEVIAFWEWSRRFFQATSDRYASIQPHLATQSDIGHLYKAQEVPRFLTEQACLTQLTVIGAGLDMLRTGRTPPPGFEGPPKLSFVKTRGSET